MTVKVDVQLNESAIKDVISEAMEEYVSSGELEYPCPECGSPITITGPENVCKCGFNLKVEISEPEL